MAQTHKLLVRSKPAAATNTIGYTTPAATKALVTSIVAANVGAAADTIRIFIVEAAGIAAVGNAIYYDLPLPDNDTFVANVAILCETDVDIVVYSLNGDTTFTISGIEIT